MQEVGRPARHDDRLSADRQASHREDEEIDGVGQKRQAKQNLERARPQQQPNARAPQYADGNGDDDFHQLGLGLEPDRASPPATAARGPRNDWWAIEVRISSVAPTTVAKTPMSKNIALGM